MGRGTREHEPAAGRENTSREGGANNGRGRNSINNENARGRFRYAGAHATIYQNYKKVTVLGNSLESCG